MWLGGNCEFSANTSEKAVLAKMKCPFCNEIGSKVVDKRARDEQYTTIRRRRECLKCKKRYTTYEEISEPNFVVIKKDGRREDFDREKIKRGVIKACEKRPVTEQEIDNLVDSVEAMLRNKKTNQVQTKTIGAVLLRKLKKLDEIAYLRFASVHMAFDNIENFEAELNKLKKGDD